uniref:Uncharacterized protein n=1 Tax=Desulfobacca acetoxidans TaxID=60893 RepID=A0A7V4LDC7_9BACT
MPRVFSFCFRLFLAFLAARFLSRLFGLTGWGPLFGFAAFFLGNIYLFDYLNFRERFPRRPPPGGGSGAEPAED